MRTLLRFGDQVAVMTSREWLLKRNCSISPRQLVLAYLVLCATSLLVATFFAVTGAWYILGFAILEQLAVGVAFFLYARHASDREHIALVDNCLLVELTEIEQVSEFRLDPRFAHVELPVTRSDLVGIEANGIRVEVGRFLTEWKRRELATELRSALASNR